MFEYSVPDQNTVQPKKSDIGGHHLVFYVDDMDAAVAYLKAQGLDMLGDLKEMTSGPSAGESWVYFLSPWVMPLELVSYPNGKAYQRQTSRRLFSPGMN